MHLAVTAAGEQMTEHSPSFPVALVGLSSHLVLLRRYVSRQAWGKGRALMENLGLSGAEIAKCFGMHPLNEEESVQQGLQVWMERGANTTWDALLKAMETASIAVQQRDGLRQELCSSTGDSTWTAAVTHECVVHVHMFTSYPVPIFIPNFVCTEVGPGDIGGGSKLPTSVKSHFT